MTDNMKGTKKLSKSRFMWIAFMILTAVETVLVYKLLVSNPVSIFLTISVIAIVVWMVIILRRQGTGPQSMENEDLKAELNDIKKEIGNIDNQIGLLSLAAMSHQMYMNIRKLANPPFGNYEKREGSPFESELNHLVDIGYIEILKPKHSLQDIPESGTDLSNYISVTHQGKLFVQMMEKRKIATSS